MIDEENRTEVVRLAEKILNSKAFNPNRFKTEAEHDATDLAKAALLLAYCVRNGGEA